MKIRYVIKSYSTIGEHDIQILYYTSSIRRANDVGEWHRWIGYALLFNSWEDAALFIESMEKFLCFEIVQIHTKFAFAHDSQIDMIVSNMPI
jgi:hypothetical protein